MARQAQLRCASVAMPGSAGLVVVSGEEVLFYFFPSLFVLF